MIEGLIIGVIAYCLFIATYMLAWRVKTPQRDEPYTPSQDYAEDFAARLSGTKQPPGSAQPHLRGSGRPPNAEPGGGDVVDMRKLGTGPRGHYPTTRTTPVIVSPGRSAAQKDRPLHIVP